MNQRRITTKARLESNANVIIRKTKFGAFKRNHEGETRDTRWRMNRSGESRSDLGSKFHTPRMNRNGESRSDLGNKIHLGPN
jgi:hypothetical protein